MELETPLQPHSRAADPELAPEVRRPSAFAMSLGLFFLLWIVFFLLQRELPYLKNGSDIVFSAKLRFEQTGQVFPSDRRITRLLIFGNSKILAGFMPELFDRMAAADGLQVSSFNSGFPGSDLLLPPLKAMCARGQAPDILLLTLPWHADPAARNIFHLIPDDHAAAEDLFPFRYWLRDFTDFVLNARSHGGLRSSYREARDDEKQVLADRGRYLITEQSRFPGGRLPEDFHLPSDRPDQLEPRPVPAHSEEIGELNSLIDRYHIRCFFLPYYLRDGEAAPPPSRDEGFARVVEGATPCRVLGPDYLLYPNAFFADQTHVNTAGARVYTAAIYGLVRDRVGSGSGHALQ